MAATPNCHGLIEHLAQHFYLSTSISIDIDVVVVVIIVSAGACRR